MLLSHRMLAAASGTSGGYIVEQSGLFDGSTGYLSRTPATAGNQTKWTVSAWVKLPASGSRDIRLLGCYVGQSQQSSWNVQTDGSGGANFRFVSTRTPIYTYFINLTGTAKFRDPTGWNHVVIVYDSAQATSADRVKAYWNGVRDTLTGTFPGLNNTTLINSTSVQTLYRTQNEAAPSTIFYTTGYGTETVFVDGQALTPSDFAETDANGYWVPKSAAGLTFGTNGFWIKDPSTGTDSSGNGNNFTKNGSITQTADSPTDSADDGVGNYATFNPLYNQSFSGGAEYSNGNLTVGAPSSTVIAGITTLAADAADNTYVEFTIDNQGSGASLPHVGIIKIDEPELHTGHNSELRFDFSTEGYAYRKDAVKINNGSTAGYGVSWTTGDVLGIHLNAGTLTFYKNGASQGSAYSGISGTYLFGVYGQGSAFQATLDANPSTKPTDAVALATHNLPTTDGKLSDHFKTVLYTGINPSSNSVTGVGFSPDLVWIKSRAQLYNHYLFDSLRGATKTILPNATNAESTEPTSLSSFDADGFTVIDNGQNDPASGTDGFVAWCMSLPTDETNSDGSITTTLKKNTTLGVTIGTYTGNNTAGATIGHGGGQTPFMIIHKQLNTTRDWWVTHEALNSGAGLGTYRLRLNDTVAEAQDSTAWNNTAPNSSVITLGANVNTNASAGDYLFIAFFETDFCKPISYTGNGSTDGTLVYLDGQPVWECVKRKDSTSNWRMFDRARDPSNSVGHCLFPSASVVEENVARYDALATGIKLRHSSEPNIGAWVGWAFVEPVNPTGPAQSRPLPN